MYLYWDCRDGCLSSTKGMTYKILSTILLLYVFYIRIVDVTIYTPPADIDLYKIRMTIKYITVIACPRGVPMSIMYLNIDPAVLWCYKNRGRLIPRLSTTLGRYCRWESCTFGPRHRHMVSKDPFELEGGGAKVQNMNSVRAYFIVVLNCVL